MGEEIKEVDLDHTRRLGAPKEDKVRSIIVKLVRYKTRNRVFRNKKKLKGKQVSMKKNLTKMQMEAIKRARKEFEFHNVWTNDATSSRCSRYFIYLPFWFVLGVSGLFAYATAFHM